MRVWLRRNPKTGNIMKPFDKNFTIQSNAQWEQATLRVFLPDRWQGDHAPLGEVVIRDAPRQLVARCRNGTIERMDGKFVAFMPPDWELPAAPLRFRFLLALESRRPNSRGRVIYCGCWGLVLNHPSTLPQGYFVGFDSWSQVFLIPKGADVETVLRYETLLVGDPTDIMTLIQYQGWLWENAKLWTRLKWIERALKTLASQPLALS